MSLADDSLDAEVDRVLATPKIAYLPNAMAGLGKEAFAKRPWGENGWSSPEGKTWTEVEADAATWRSKPENVKDAFNCVNVLDLMNAPSENRPWAITGVLRAPGTALLAGDPKIGKSAAMRVLAVATATGQPFLERPVCEGPVLWIAADGEPTHFFTEHIRLLLNGCSLKHDIKRIGLSDLPPVSERNAWLQKAIKAFGYVLVIIDNIVNFYELGELDTKYGVIAKFTSPLLETMQKTTCSLVMITHTNNQGKPFGGASWLRVADINLLYHQGRERARYIESVLGGRGDASLDPVAVAYDRQTGWLNVAENPWTIAVKAAEQAILDSVPGGREDLVRRSGYGAEIARPAFDNLVMAGLLVMQKTGRREFWYTPDENGRPMSPLSSQQDTISNVSISAHTHANIRENGQNEPRLSLQTKLDEPERGSDEVQTRLERVSDEVHIHYCQGCGKELEHEGKCNDC